MVGVQPCATGVRRVCDRICRSIERPNNTERPREEEPGRLSENRESMTTEASKDWLSIRSLLDDGSAIRLTARYCSIAQRLTDLSITVTIGATSVAETAAAVTSPANSSHRRLLRGRIKDCCSMVRRKLESRTVWYLIRSIFTSSLHFAHGALLHVAPDRFASDESECHRLPTRCQVFDGPSHVLSVVRVQPCN